MSAANVRLLTIDGASCPDGEKPARFQADCVNANKKRFPGERRFPCAMLLIAEGPHSAAHGIKRDGQNQNGGRAQWDWDGNRGAPTFSPSINCEGHCGWHGYIRNGRCVDQNGADS